MTEFAWLIVVTAAALGLHLTALDLGNKIKAIPPPVLPRPPLTWHRRLLPDVKVSNWPFLILGLAAFSCYGASRASVARSLWNGF